MKATFLDAESLKTTAEAIVPMCCESASALEVQWLRVTTFAHRDAATVAPDGTVTRTAVPVLIGPATSSGAVNAAGEIFSGVQAGWVGRFFFGEINARGH